MGATVNRNGKEYYKADDGKLYQNYDAAVKALGPAPAKSAPAPVLNKANAALTKAGQKQVQEDSGLGGFIKNFNPVEAVASVALNNPVAAGFRSGMRMVGDALGQGAAMDAMDNAVRSVTGDRRQASPSNYTGSGRTAIADGIDGAISRGAKPNAAGYVAVDYPDYNSTGDGLIAGRLMGRKNADGSYEISPTERYDFNASAVSKDDRAKYKANLDGAMTQAIKDGSPLRVLANAPDYLNYYTGAGGRGMNIGGKFNRPGQGQPAEQSGQSNYVPNAPMTTPSAPLPSQTNPSPESYSVQAGDTLSAIARQRGVSVEQIANINNISNVNQIGVGQQLRFK